MIDHRAKAEQLLTDGNRTDRWVTEAHVHATIALVDALRQLGSAETDRAEETGVERLTPEQNANRQALAGRLRAAGDHAETVHSGQYGRSLRVLLGFLAHHIDDPAHPQLGLMPRHAALVADHLAEQAQRAAESEVSQ
ncbi:hypothetical protein [Saccharopolyspora sp. NPDC050642]|uniref:hypothetical protein n=1 Tax=Saccharopolyspora sp. NPDC050642 TaxID=3157099 RepID=UPI0033DEF992